MHHWKRPPIDGAGPKAHYPQNMGDQAQCISHFLSPLLVLVANMNKKIVCSVVVILGYSGTAFAGCGDAGSYLNQSQVNNVLGGSYACGKSTALNPPGWNERHVAGGSLVEQHEGGATVENVGTWSTANVGGRGRVSYAYTGGAAPVYEVAVVSGNCTGAACTSLPQTYQFCGVGGGAPAVLSVYVSSTFQPPSSPGVMNTNCPPNP